jgi:hypothetical protein
MKFFAVHPVVEYILGPHGEKSSKPDMQGQGADLHPFAAQGLEYTLGKMQTGGGSGDRSGDAGKNGLISFTVHGSIIPPDIRRKRDASHFFHGGHEIAAAVEPDMAIRRFSPRNDHPFDPPSQEQPGSGGRRF